MLSFETIVISMIVAAFSLFGVTLAGVSLYVGLDPANRRA